MERKIGTIEDIVAIAKSHYSNLDEQARYIQVGVDLIKRDYADDVKCFGCSKDGYDYHITGFGNAGRAYFWYNIFRGTTKVASVLEMYRNESDEYEVIFFSNKAFSGPIAPMLIE